MKRPADVIPINRAASWIAVRDGYSKLVQMRWQSVQHAAEVGRMLIELKAHDYADDNKAFLSRVIKETDIQQAHVYRLMNISTHWPKLLKHKPDSLRAALALIPKKKPKKQKAKAAPVEVEDDADDEEPITPAQYREAFDMRASTIRGVVRAIDHYAQFGTPTQAMLTELRAIALLIENTAQKLEKQI